MAKKKKSKSSGRFTQCAKVGNLEARVSGKVMRLENHRTPAEHHQFLAEFAAWRSVADSNFCRRKIELMELIRPYRSLALLGQAYICETTANPETYKEWEHQGLAAKIEHLALLLLGHDHDGDEWIVP